MEGGFATRGTVLILEDDPGIRRLQRRHLERLGFGVVEAENLAEAHRQVDLHQPNLLVLDYQLGDDENGLQFYRTLQEQGRDIPAILVTGLAEEGRILEAMRAGLRDFLPKTPNFIELLPPLVENVMKQVRQERRMLEAEAASRAKDRFLATLSHELRTPLTPVLALVSELRHDPRLPAEVREDLDTVHRNVTLEARLIDDLLDLTRISRGKVELKLVPLDLRPILELTLKSICGVEASAKNVECDIDLAAADHRVLGDPARLTQVYWNLLKNAIKFTPAGGRVRIRSVDETKPGEGEWLVIEVSDSGIGIDAAVLPRIFESFEQGDREITRQFGGLGLGLAISRPIVEAHGGTLTAASAGPGAGSTFSVRLPICRVKETPPIESSPVGVLEGSSVAATPPAAQPEAHTRQKPGAHLLLVEDHADSGQILARMLRRAGYHVTLAGSVTSALAAMEAATKSVEPNGVPFDVRLVISDLGLPDGTGLELMCELRSRYRVPGIALSGFGMDADVRRATEAGFARHLTKPVDLAELLRVVQEILAQ